MWIYSGLNWKIIFSYGFFGEGMSAPFSCLQVFTLMIKSFGVVQSEVTENGKKLKDAFH